MKEHDRLFQQYVQELRQSMALALDWWNEVIADETLKSEEGAEMRVARRWPFGAASHPYVIATYRKYFLECERLNDDIRRRVSSISSGSSSPLDREEDWGITDPMDALDHAVPVSGWVLLIDRLRGSHNELARFMSHFVFQPIGSEPRTNQFL